MKLNTSITNSIVAAAQCRVMPEAEKFSENEERWLVKQHQPQAKNEINTVRFAAGAYYWQLKNNALIKNGKQFIIR